MAYTTINKSTDYFNTLTYTGTGSNGTKTGVGFQPDWTWIKARNNTTWHHLYDAVRGAGSEKEIFSNSNDQEGAGDTAAYGYLSAFTSDGFSTVMGSNTGSDSLNKSGTNFVAWNWKANGAGSANSDGATASTVSVNTTAGFSIVKYTGTGSQTTVGHGLGVVPDMMIIRNLSSTEDWSVYHSANGVGKYQALNTTEAASSNNNRFNVAPTSSVFTVNTHDSVNKNGDNHIAYCFASKTGYSKFGSYIGNGNSDGTFVYTGFKPAFFLLKRSNTTQKWILLDNKREGYNSKNDQLYPNANDVEGDGENWFDIVSNGIKFRNGDNEHNGSGDTYIYMAFGQSLVGSNNIPCTAR